MNPNSKTYAVGGIAIVLLALLGIAYFASKHAAPLAPMPQTGTTSPTASDTSTTTINGQGYTITQVPVSSLKNMPSLDRPVAFAASVPPDARAILSTNIAAAQARLKLDPSRVSDWYNLAIYYHEADDFQSARLIWEFLIKAAPKNTIAYMNLGKLYLYDLKDYPKAESYFKLAIARDPKDLSPYLELSTLYQYAYKQNTTLAVDTLTHAASIFATSSAPYIALGAYYRDKGDATSARAAYEKALERARTQGDAVAMQAIAAEIAKLPLQNTRTQ